MNQTAARGYWRSAMQRLWADKLARVCLAILALYFVLASLTAMGLVAAHWNDEAGVSFANPSFLADQANPQGKSSFVTQQTVPVDDKTRAIDPLAPYYAEIDQRATQYAQTALVPQWSLPFGGDRWGRDVLAKAIKAGQVSIAIGVSAALIAVVIGTLLGALGGYFGGSLGDLLEWFYNVFTALPYILLVLACAAVLGQGALTVVLVLGLTGWTGTYRLVRAEFIKQRSREYVQAASAIGASHASIIFVHILPNVSHLVLIQLSQAVVDFIKAEVVLSFLGFGVPIESISWGIMIGEVLPELILGKWWQLATVGVVMSTFVVAFGLFTDVLRDALDPTAKRH